MAKLGQVVGCRLSIDDLFVISKCEILSDQFNLAISYKCVSVIFRYLVVMILYITRQASFDFL